MGFCRYFTYRHPITNFFVQDPDDLIKGWKRRTVIISVVLMTFLINLFLVEAVYDSDEENISNDLDELGDGTVTGHFVTIMCVSVGLIVVTWLMVCYVGLPERDCCQHCCCTGCRSTINWHAFVLLVISIVLWAVLARDKPELILDWLWTYAFFAVVVTPLRIALAYFMCGGKERESLAERERQDKERGAQQSINLAESY